MSYLNPSQVAEEGRSKRNKSNEVFAFGQNFDYPSGTVLYADVAFSTAQYRYHVDVCKEEKWNSSLKHEKRLERDQFKRYPIPSKF